MTDPDRVLRDLTELRAIGRYKTGVHRPTLSPEDMEARRWLAGKLAEIGHEVTIDGIANVFGRAPTAGPVVLGGSHIESQNHAGWLDGALGVVYALEAARAVAADPALGGKGVDVIAFADEEGHFMGEFPGALSFTGGLDPARVDRAEDRSGRGSLRAMLAAAGLADKPHVRMEPGRYRAFLEAHIEQGDWLESEGLSIGIVTSIVGIWQYRITFSGVQNHAGTTRMAIRRDAGTALMRLWHRIEERFPQIAGPRSVWTIGRVTLDPGAPSVIPGGAEMTLQFRDAEPETLSRLRAELDLMIDEANRDGPCPVTLEVHCETEPAVMDAGVQDRIEAAAEALLPGRHARMPSGAGHDAQVIAGHLPTGMIFVPSIGGISHHWSENTSDDDIRRGAEVYVETAKSLLTDLEARSK
ncbi:hydantoinase/carbamoylase family amidase [Rhodobacteraceae bacterium NNCM2]|nr:hydantoinase/carbamoylase family amidase [Coraliihabitans acroporae]